MWIAIAVAAVLFAADRLLKNMARRGKLPDMLFPGGYISLEHLENGGLLTGLDSKRPGLNLLLTALGYIGMLVLLLPELAGRKTLTRTGICLVLAGGASNLLDRLLHGTVTDYIRFAKSRFQRLRQLVWNIADLMLLVGGILTVIGLLKRK